MKTNKILYAPTFLKQFKKLPLSMRKKIYEKLKLFRENPFHPSLRLHSLRGKFSGYYSISPSRSIRVIFELKDDESIHLISIGTHAIYE